MEPVRQELERLRPLVKPSHLRAGIPKVRQAVVARLQDPDLHRTFAELLDHVSDYEGAEAEWRAYVRLLPHSSLGRYSLGQTLERRGDIAGAKEQYLRSVAVGSSFAGGHERLGVLLARSGDFRGALPHLEKAVLSDPAQPAVRLSLAEAYSKLDRKSEARRQLQVLLQFDPGNADAKRLLNGL
jgi:tetratricopeptide (TPR) repeat protein